jgi:hypothetical protein
MEVLLALGKLREGLQGELRAPQADTTRIRRSLALVKAIEWQVAWPRWGWPNLTQVRGSASRPMSKPRMAHLGLLFVV